MPSGYKVINDTNEYSEREFIENMKGCKLMNRVEKLRETFLNLIGIGAVEVKPHECDCKDCGGDYDIILSSLDDEHHERLTVFFLDTNEQQYWFRGKHYGERSIDFAIQAYFTRFEENYALPPCTRKQGDKHDKDSKQ
jgi:hypothetical protein